jgi:hypothetical protein
MTLFILFYSDTAFDYDFCLAMTSSPLMNGFYDRVGDAMGFL